MLQNNIRIRLLFKGYLWKLVEVVFCVTRLTSCSWDFMHILYKLGYMENEAAGFDWVFKVNVLV